MAIIPSTVDFKLANMRFVRWPDHIVREVSRLVTSWVDNGVDIEDELSDHVWDSYLRRSIARAFAGGLNVNEMRFVKQTWRTCVEEAKKRPTV